MTTIDMKKISVYNFLEIANSKWIIEQYLKSIPDIDDENFSSIEEKQIYSTEEFKNLENSINKKFSWKL